MMKLLVVALGGAFGAVARYGTAVVVAMFWKQNFPLTTFLVNVTGSFAVGFFATFAAEKAAIDPLWRLLVTTGFLGAYTTFSTFEYETQRLTESGQLWLAALNILASVAAGFAAAQLGVILARR